jgi:hypothetical protein
MTIVRGESIVAARCCGARYALPRYLSMNDRSSAYWTDGWREQSLMPSDEGLRRCKCGRFVVLRELVEIERVETSEFPRVGHVSDELLPACIAQTESEEVEVAAQLTHWRLINHPYRQCYREHRAAEEAATPAVWDTASPDRRTWWDRLLRRPTPASSARLSGHRESRAWALADESVDHSARLRSQPRPRSTDRAGDLITSKTDRRIRSANGP